MGLFGRFESPILNSENAGQNHGDHEPYSVDGGPPEVVVFDPGVPNN